MEQKENLSDENNTQTLNTIFFKYDDLLLAHTSDVRRVNEKITAELEKLREDYRQRHLKLEDQTKILQQREDALKEKQRKIHNEKKKLKLKKSVRKRLSFFKPVVDKCYSSRKETDGIKREITMLHKRRAELEEKLNAESFESLQSEITNLEIALRVIEDEDSINLQEKLKDLQSKVVEKEEELQVLKEFKEVHTLGMQQKDVELQDARQELINGLKTHPTCSHIRVKRMGLLDTEPFFVRCYSKEKMNENATKFASLSRRLVEDPNWHPFKVIDTGCDKREILDEEDEKIVMMKAECSEEEYHAIVIALNELKEYNPSGSCSHSVEELWNNIEKRKASLKEGIECIFEEWKLRKRLKKI